VEAVKNTIYESTSFVYLFFIFLIGTGLCSYMYFAFGLKCTYSEVAIIIFSAANLVYLKYNNNPALHFFQDIPIRKVLISVFLLLFSCLISYFCSDNSPFLVNALRIVIRLIFLFFAFLTIMSNKVRFQQIMTLLVLIALFDTLMNIITYINNDAVPVKNLFQHLSISPGRGSGYIINPNVAAYTVVFLMIAGTESVPKKYRPLLWMVCGVGVLATLSRTGFTMWLIAVVSMMWMKGIISFRNDVVPILVGLGFWFIYLLILPVYLNFNSHPANNKLIAPSSASTPILVTPTKTTSALATQEAQIKSKIVNRIVQVNGSSRPRIAVVYDAIRHFISRPLLGYGIGFTDKWLIGPHNIYLKFLVEGGVFSFLSYLLMLTFLWRAAVGLGRLLVLEIGFLGFFSHNVLDNSLMWFIIAFILMHGFYQRHPPIGSKQINV
jgi:hypothetical protein